MSIETLLNPRQMFIDLATARNRLPVGINFAHARIVNATSAAAVVNVRFNDNQTDGITMSAGKRLKNWPTEKIFLSNDAQPGESMILEYWGGPMMGPPEIVDDAVIATLDGAVAISGFDTDPQIAGITDPLTPQTYAASYYRFSASNALNTVVTPAANLNGIRIDAAWMANSSNYGQAILAKSSAPSSYADTTADPLLVKFSGSATEGLVILPACPLIIPAGLGLYEKCNSAGATSAAGIIYEVL